MTEAAGSWNAEMDVAATPYTAAHFAAQEMGSKQPVSNLDPIRASVAKLLCYAAGNANAVGVGTGVFIADDVLLTAAHVLYDVRLFGGYVDYVQIVLPGDSCSPSMFPVRNGLQFLSQRKRMDHHHAKWIWE